MNFLNFYKNPSTKPTLMQLGGGGLKSILAEGV
jgi:hypothetical protein